MNIIKKVLQKELSEKNLIFPFICDLNLQETTVLRDRNKKNPLTLEAIAKKLGGFTRERVRQIESKANEKIEAKEKIIDTLVYEIEKEVFTPEEVEAGVTSYLGRNKKIPFKKLKVEALEIVKEIWKQKK